MAMTLTLIKGCAVNGTSYATNKATLDAQLSYFNSFPFKTYNVNTTRLGEPIRLGAAYSEIMGYNYGYIDYGDGFKYFLSVTGASMITESQTEIQYEIDAYETLCNQGGLSFNRAYMTKYPVERGDVHLSSEPYNWVENGARTLTHPVTFIAIASVETSGGSSVTSTFIIPITSDTVMATVLNMGWLGHTTGLSTVPTTSDFYICAICPFEISVNTAQWQNVKDDFIDYDIYYSAYRYNHLLTDTIGFSSISSTLYKRGVIKDMRNNIVWSCPINHTYEVVEARLVCNATACNVVVTLKEGYDYQVATIPCELMDVYVDSWREYLSRQRDSDKALRQISYDQTAWQSGISSLTGGINGAMSGSLAGSSAGVGAVAGIGLGVVSALGNYVVNRYYDPKLQEQYDRQSQRQNDTLSLSGNVSLDMYYHNYAGKVDVYPDTISRLQLMNEDSEYGYSTVLYLDSDPRIYNSQRLTGPMRGSVDISADAPREWLDQIASRFDSGIRFI